MTEPAKFTFSKPNEILKESRFKESDFPSETDYILSKKKEIESKFKSLKLRIRKAELSDISRVLELAAKAYENHVAKDLVSSYDYFQSITYSFGLVICTEDDRENLVGCFFNYIFHGNGDKVCNLKRLAVEPDYQRYGLGKFLFEYNQLLVKEIYGSRIQTGLIEYNNFPSLALVLNRMGAVIDFCTDDMTEHFLCYSFVIPLDMESWNQMEVSQASVVKYLEGLERDEDYIMFEFDDKQKMAEVCANKDYKISAALSPWVTGDKALLVAFSDSILNLKLKD